MSDPFRSAWIPLSAGIWSTHRSFLCLALVNCGDAGCSPTSSLVFLTSAILLLPLPLVLSKDTVTSSWLTRGEGRHLDPISIIQWDDREYKKRGCCFSMNCNKMTSFPFGSARIFWVWWSDGSDCGHGWWSEVLSEASSVGKGPMMLTGIL